MQNLSSERSDFIEINKLACVALVCTLLLLGCGDDRGLVPVSGTVTFQGAEMPAEGTMTFLPMGDVEGFPSRPAVALFQSNGSFRARTYEPNDGLYPGEYKVTLECWKVPPTIQGPAAQSFIDPVYGSPQSSTLTVSVKPGDRSVTCDFDVGPPPVASR